MTSFASRAWANIRYTVSVEKRKEVSHFPTSNKHLIEGWNSYKQFKFHKSFLFAWKCIAEFWELLFTSIDEIIKLHALKHVSVSLNFSVHFLNRNTFNTVFLKFSVKCSQLSVTRTFLNFCWSFVLLEVDILFSVSLGKENNCIEWKLPFACVHKNLLALWRAVITWF